MNTQNISPQELEVVSKAAGAVKILLDALKADGINSPYLDAADNLAAGVQASLASGVLDPKALVPPLVAELAELQATVANPIVKAILARLASLLGKLVPPASGGGH